MAEMEEVVMGERGAEQSYGCHSMCAPLRSVVLMSPGAAFARADPRAWHYTARPDLEEARREHDAFTELVGSRGAAVHVLEGDDGELADALYVHDPALVSDAGYVRLRMGKELRHGEEMLLGASLESLGVPRHFDVTEGDPSALAEAGDCIWIDSELLAVGRSFRTNGAGIEQLGRGLGELGVEIVVLDLPVGDGPDACLHLGSVLSVVADDLAVVYTPLLPVALYDLLRDRGFDLIDVPDEEFPTMGPNVLALEPGVCILLEENVETARALVRRGCEVLTYRGREISHKAEGGPTCLTRPVWRTANPPHSKS